MIRIIFLAISVIICFSASAWGADVKQQLRGIKNEIKHKKRLISKTARVESIVSGELAKIDLNLKEKEKSLNQLNRDLQLAERKLGQTATNIEAAKRDVERKKDQIQKRLVSIYKAGNVSNIRFYFSAESFPEMLQDVRYMKSLVDHDKIIVAEYKDKIRGLKVLQEKLQRDTRNKEKIKTDIELKKKEIVVEKEQKAQFLAKVKQDKTRYQESLRELEANSKRLQSIIRKLEAASRKRALEEREKAAKAVKKGAVSPPLLADRGFASQKGRLSVPVRGRIISGFGRHKHPRFNSYTFNNGISIAAPIGTEVHAVYDGKVIFADYFKGYGNLLIVDHGGGYFSLYAHNSKILKKVGTTIAKNDVVATVGDGDSSDGPMLYFEIRYQGKPVDPSTWIR
jgi:septal ring factor EnvC (AmiA/AmiB activator)